MPWFCFDKAGDDPVARLKAFRTPGVKPAAGRNIRWARDIAFQNYTLSSLARIGFRYRRQQRFGVWMKRAAKESFGFGLLYDYPQVHNRYTVGEVVNHMQIVAY